MPSFTRPDDESSDYSALDDILDEYGFNDESSADSPSHSETEPEYEDDSALGLVEEDQEEAIDLQGIDLEALDELDKSLQDFPSKTTEDALEDSTSQYVDYKDISDDLSTLNSLSERVEEDEDVASIIAAQQSVNRGVLAGGRTLPKNMLDDPVDFQKKYDGGSGDEALMRKIFFSAVGLVIASILLFGTIPFLTKPDEQPVASSAGQNISIGTIIEQSGGGSTLGGSAPTGNVTATPTTPPVNVPEGGSRIDYSITTEGNIQSVSVAWVDANGESDTETGVSLPWNMSVGANANVIPVLAATSTGTGTITCTITQDGVEVATKTVSGDSPEVSCQA